MFKPPYSDQIKDSALKMLETAGYPSQRGVLVAVSRTMGIPTATLRRWVVALPGDTPSVALLTGAGPLTSPPDPHCMRGGETDARPVPPLPDAIRAELLATLRSMAAARPEATYKELSTGFGLLADKLKVFEPPDGPSESGPGEAKERLAQLVGVGPTDSQEEA